MCIIYDDLISKFPNYLPYTSLSSTIAVRFVL